MEIRKSIAPEDHELPVRSTTRGRRKTIVVIGLVLALIALGYGFLLPAPFKAQARLHVASQPPRILFETGDTKSGGIDDYRRYQATQQALVKSRLVLSAALRDSRVARYQMVREQTDPIAWLQERLGVEFIGGSEVMKISLSGSNPEKVAGLVNAVKQAYMGEVVNVEARRRAERHDRLKVLKETYTAIMKKKRETVRKLSEMVGRGEPLTDPGKDALHRLAHDLRSRQVQLRLERAEAETLLERRKKGDGSTTEPALKEIASLEDRLAVLKASQTVLSEELERLTREMHPAAIRELDLKQHKDEIARMEDTARKIGAEVEALNVELEAPPRIRSIDDAAVPGR